VADRHYIIQEGKTVDMFRNEEVDRNTKKIESYLGV